MKELVRELGAVLEARKRCEWLVCRYLADLSDRVELVPIVGLTGFSDVYDAARRLFGLGMRSTRERLRVGRKLRELPHIERAFVDNELSYAKVRALTRAATPETELEWLACARERGIRDLERLVTTRSGLSPRPVMRPDAASREDWATPNGVEITFSMTTEAWVILRRALEVARGRTAGGTDGESLAEVARAALASEGGELQYTLALQRCTQCARMELDIGNDTVEIDHAAAAVFIPGLATRTAGPELGQHDAPPPTTGSSQEPVQSRDPVGSARDRVGPSRDPVGPSRDPVGSSRDPVGSSRDPVGSSRDPVGPSRDPVGSSRDPVGPSRDPVGSSQDPVGSSFGVPGATTHDERFGNGPGIRTACPPETELGPNERQVLAAMGGRGGWYIDQLCERTGLGLSEVSQAIGALLIERLVTSEACLYSPVRSPRPIAATYPPAPKTAATGTDGGSAPNQRTHVGPLGSRGS